MLTKASLRVDFVPETMITRITVYYYKKIMVFNFYQNAYYVDPFPADFYLKLVEKRTAFIQL